MIIINSNTSEISKSQKRRKTEDAIDLQKKILETKSGVDKTVRILHAKHWIFV
jgi:hypothetical protein